MKITQRLDFTLCICAQSFSP